MHRDWFRIFILIIVIFCVPTHVWAKHVKPSSKNYKEYLKFFEEIYKTFQENYYEPPPRATYDRFIKNFTEKIYSQLASEGRSDDYVRWRSAWYLVDALKTQDDPYSQFYPPKPADKFQKEALGQRVDLGIEGTKNADGYLVTRIEPRSDAADKGLQVNDLILSVDGKSIKDLVQDEVDKLLTPLINTKVKLSYLAVADKSSRTIEVTSQEYFKQTVLPKDIPVDGIFCLQIPHFNRMTGADLLRFLMIIRQHNPKGLILDLRGNPGGPPLAAREMSAFFLEGGQMFAYFQKHGQDKAELDVPMVAPQYKYTGPLVILVNQDSGSAAELFTGIMQNKGRAVVMGTTTAGHVMLKSMFPFKDSSMVVMVTSLGYYPDGHAFGFKGVEPNAPLPGVEGDQLLIMATAYLLKENQKTQ